MIKDVDITQGNFRANIDLSKYDERIKKAQYYLDSEVMTAMLPYIPIRTGSLRQRTLAESQSVAGTGKVYAAVKPYGRFHYYGKVMVDEETGSPWAKRGHKKVVTERPLKWTNPLTQPMWFEPVKAQNKDRWINGLKEIIGGGKDG